VASTVAHVLVERDVFSYDTPVVEVWPEFGAYSKDSATLRHVLTHSAWVPAVPRDTTLEQLCDWDEIANSATGVSIAVTKNRFNPIEMNVVGQVSEIVTKTFS
jgi:CubicO group peptidase (beta-lactamase class C family)